MWPAHLTERYDFSHVATGEDFGDIFRLLVEQRFLVTPSPMQLRDYTLRVLQCMRVLMRDPAHRSLFSELGGAEVLVQLFVDLATEHTTHPHAEFASEMLVEALSILKRFASLEALCPAANTAAGELRLQRALVDLLSTREALVLQCVLVAIQQLVQLEPHLTAIGQLGCAEIMLRILTDYEPSFRPLAAELLELLLRERTFLQDIVLHDGTAAILSALHSDDVNVQLPLLHSLERLAAHGDSAKDIRRIGGINILLTLCSATIVPRVAVAMCSVLTALALDDEAALQIRKANGVYLLARLLLNEAPEEGVGSSSTLEARPSPSEGGDDGVPAARLADCGIGASGEPSQEMLAAHVFRTLRFVFSTERNRTIFRRLFPPDMFGAFIDLGHYVRELGRYQPLAQQLARISAETRLRMQEALADINMIKGNSRHYIKDYAVQELLGKGAFGSVYQAKKDTGETLFAVKELPLDAVSGAGVTGHGGKETESQQPASYLRREVKILSTLQHPNIVRYYESFQHGSTLYIVMELVEGATLLDHLNSLAEKGQTMPEDRIWSFFTQMCLALRYIHKEKQVVHRDLTPSNILITADSVVKLADFGLAKQRMGTNSVMDSVVGTVLYQCPEIIQHETYGEKADIWSLGCILYQTAMLRPPFEGSNPLVVASAIVEGKYPPLNDSYQPLLAEVVSRLLCVEPSERPDVDAVSSLISPVLMAELGRVSKAEHTLRAEVHMERDWRQRHEREASRNKEAVHRLFARHQLGTSQRAAGGMQRDALEPSPLRRSVQASRSPMLSISPSRIREIHDPCSRILNQLHKILFISQLPPSMEGELSAERQLIDKYKRELFSHRNHYRGRNLKDELHKVMSGSQEMIDLAFRSPTADADPSSGYAAKQRISYEELQRYIEQVLAETGYYALTNCSADELEVPPLERAASMPSAMPERAMQHPPPPALAAALAPDAAPVRLRTGSAPRGGKNHPIPPIIPSPGGSTVQPVHRLSTTLPVPHEIL